MRTKFWALDSGSGTVLGLAVLLGCTLLLASLTPALMLAKRQVQLAELADTVALAASDARRGLVPGYPCNIAEHLAQTDGAVVKTCRIVGDGVKIELSGRFQIWSLRATSKAGAP